MTRAAEILFAAISPGDEMRGSRSDLPPVADERLRSALRLVNEAEDLLSPGFGQPDERGGEAKLIEASRELEALRIFELPHDVVLAVAKTLRLIDPLTGRGG